MATHELKRVGFHFVGDYADRIAHAANNWAFMEYELHSLLWALADTSPAVGACLTSQIYTFNAKLDAPFVAYEASQGSRQANRRC